MAKLSKTQLKKIARMHAAAVLMATESSWAFEASRLSREEIQYLDKTFENIAGKLLQGETPIYNADEIVNYVKNNPE